MDSAFSEYWPVASCCKHVKVLSSIVGEKYLPKTRNFQGLWSMTLRCSKYSVESNKYI